jgi:putative CocE/NonD family hydrolase
MHGKVFCEDGVAMPMRDGVVLRAKVCRPDAPGRFPCILVRTPYGNHAGYDRLAAAGYAVIGQDFRGRYASDGEFVPFTEERTRDAEDGYDSVEWVARQPWSNGRVGTMGASYKAWAQWKLAALRPPHLVAMHATTIPLELTGVDWPGAFRAGRRARWWLANVAPDCRRRQGLPPPHTPAEAEKAWDEGEGRRWMDFLPWADLPKHLPPGLAEPAAAWFRNPGARPWRLDLCHPEIEVPNLDVTGWYDHCNDSIGHLAGMQARARTELARRQSRLVLGPWNHVGHGARATGGVDFGAPAAVDMDALAIRWFDCWLKGEGNGVREEPAVRYFVMGSGEWKSAPAWPPPGASPRALHLRGSGGLAAEAAGDEPPDGFTYDPRDPVPTLWSKEWFTQPSDRRALEGRRDLLRYRTDPLREAVEIAGHPEVVLFASSSAPDTDFFASLVDERPDGFALEVAAGMVRARHRRSWDREDFLRPGEVTEFRIRLGATACRFAAGHRIRLEITSSDFPNYDRNHNTGRNDLADVELVAAEQRVFHSKAHPSRLVLPSMPIGGGFARDLARGRHGL